MRFKDTRAPRKREATTTPITSLDVSNAFNINNELILDIRSDSLFPDKQLNIYSTNLAQIEATLRKTLETKYNDRYGFLIRVEGDRVEIMYRALESMLAFIADSKSHSMESPSTSM